MFCRNSLIAMCLFMTAVGSASDCDLVMVVGRHLLRAAVESTWECSKTVACWQNTITGCPSEINFLLLFGISEQCVVLLCCRFPPLLCFCMILEYPGALDEWQNCYNSPYKFILSPYQLSLYTILLNCIMAYSKDAGITFTSQFCRVASTIAERVTSYFLPA